MTIEMLKRYGANTQEGLSRCMNNEAFYLRLVRMGLRDEHFDMLKDAMASGDVKKAFDAAHTLKGVTGNLSLTPLYTPMCELTELLRGKKEMVDVGDLFQQIMKEWEKALALDA